MENNSNRGLLIVIIVLLAIIAVPVGLVMMGLVLSTVDLNGGTVMRVLASEEMAPLYLGLVVPLFIIGWQTQLTLLGSGLLTLLLSAFVFVISEADSALLVSGAIAAVGVGSLALYVVRQHRQRQAPVPPPQA